MLFFFLTVANSLYLVSYLVRDILWLRLLTVVAISTLVPYFYLQPEPLIGPIVWNGVFLGINVYQIYLLILERRPVQLEAEEERIYELVFKSITPREFVRLMKLADRRDVQSGEVLVTAGEQLDQIMLFVDGTASVRIGEDAVASLAAGQFCGEMSYLTGEAPGASVVTSCDVRLLSWQRDALKKFLGKHIDLRASIQNILGTDLVAKLRSADQAEAGA